MYKRVLLKLSGEALHDDKGRHTIDVECLDSLAKVICDLNKRHIQVAVVIGAGNIWRGKLASRIGIEPIPADFMGMLGTVINAVAMASALKKYNVEGKVFSNIPAIPDVTYAYNRDEAMKEMEDGKVIFIAGGTGKPFYTTDTAATLMALDLNCEVILMGKNGVNGVYTSDPTIDANAKFLPVISYQQMLEMKLQIMDLSAIELIKDKDIEVRVFSMDDPENFIRAAENQNIGTVCKKGE